MATHEIDRSQKALGACGETDIDTNTRLLLEGIFAESVLYLTDNSPVVKSKERIVDKLTTFVENISAGMAIIDDMSAKDKPISLPSNFSDALHAVFIAYDYVMRITPKASFLRSKKSDTSLMERFIEQMKVEVEYLKNVELGKVEPDKVKTVRAFYEERFKKAVSELPVPRLD
ncbi:MAG: hypothetical protein M1360_04550 [Candidatus Marsarchaeota archaeon]|nr:hypothetical protein [Candidatus Marsarchaeota archaeon]MCL5419176.1 hypothetical protein [Candidatus Marsarchaeota archaeon]